MVNYVKPKQSLNLIANTHSGSKLENLDPAQLEFFPLFMSDERIIPKIDLGLYEEAHAEICKRCRLRFAHLEVELVWARA